MPTQFQSIPFDPADARAALGRTLHERVAEHHSVEHWADAVLEVARR